MSETRTDLAATDGGAGWARGTRRLTRLRLGETIERLRDERGLSLGSWGICRRSSPEEIEEILGGEREVAVDHLYMPAGALGVEPGALMAGTRLVPPGRGGPRYEVASEVERDG